jgi:type I restriction enzyme S subunit
MKVPSGWRWALLADAVEINRASLAENCSEERDFFYIDLGSVDNGQVAFPCQRIKFRDAPSRARRIFERGDILMATVRPLLGSFAHVDFRPDDCVCSTGFAVLHPVKGTVGQFIFQSLFSPWFRKQYAALTAGSNYPALNASQVGELELLLPPEGEQAEIAQILRASDSCIQETEALIGLKGERRRGLLLQLVTGNRRFKQFRGKPWRHVRIGLLLEECDRYIAWEDTKSYRFASIRRRSGGLFDRGTFFGSEVKTKVLKELKEGDFVVSKRQVVHGAWGIVTKGFDGFGVSDEYDVLVNRDPKTLDMRFFNYLSQTRRLWHMAYLASNGVHIEKLIFDFDDFAKEKVTIPPTVEEQAKIVEVLSACDREIELLQKQLAALKEQKRGLMQKLLTGEVRVKV